MTSILAALAGILALGGMIIWLIKGERKAGFTQAKAEDLENANKALDKLAQDFADSPHTVDDAIRMLKDRAADKH